MNKNNEINDSTTETNDSLAQEQLIQDTLKEICHLLVKEGSEEFLVEFSKNLFTPAERRDFANRWLLVKEIEKGTTQREIAKKFGMSLCKITRGSKELRNENSAFRKMLDLLEQEKQDNK